MVPIGTANAAAVRAASQSVTQNESPTRMTRSVEV
jgi:hypothetical protein